MAVEKKFIGGNTQIQTNDSLIRLRELLNKMLFIEQRPDIDDKQIQNECNTVILDLVNINVPSNAGDIKEFQAYLTSIGLSLERLIRKSSAPEQIYINCLQTLYTQLVSHENPSAGSGILFDIYDQQSVPKAIKLLIKNTGNMGINNDNDFKKVTVTLCTWLRTFSHLKNLCHCIIHFLDGLRELQKIDLLYDIAESLVERLCLSLIIPVVRPNSVKVLSHILCSAQSKKLFLKIEPRLPNVFKSIQKHLIDSSIQKNLIETSIPPDFQHLIDLVSVFVNRFYDHRFDELSTILKDYKVSENAMTLLDVPAWHPPIMKRDPSTPIGLVNLGNTCYMNSVLQALFMTKDLTHDILLMKIPSKIINLIQQLISLLLYSVRHEVAPHEVLGERPQSFRYGHQQDSFEYLGYLLDQLHEEEKRCRTNAITTPIHSNATETITKLENGKCNGIKTELMDIDDNNLHQTITMESPPLTDESDDAINADEIKPLTNGITQNPSSNICTMIQKLFGGRLSINYKCLQCMFQSTNIDNFFDLQLSIPTASQTNDFLPSALSDKINLTTQSLINNYFTTEELTNDDKYYCDKCEALCDGERNIILEEGPTNLILVIKHFKYDRNCHARRKLLQKVHHDEYVTLTSKLSNGERKRLIYKLYSVIVHCGINIDSGHYYTYGVNGTDEWFKFNDNHISRSSFNDVKNLSNLHTPYILFYELVHCENYTENDTVNDANKLTADGGVPRTKLLTEHCRKRKAEQPRWDDLPPRLRDFVERDNLSYADHIRNKYQNDRDFIKNYYNKHHKSDNDQDPPSSCGGSIVEPSNGYIC